MAGEGEQQRQQSSYKIMSEPVTLQLSQPVALTAEDRGFPLHVLALTVLCLPAERPAHLSQELLSVTRDKSISTCRLSALQRNGQRPALLSRLM